MKKINFDEFKQLLFFGIVTSGLIISLRGPYPKSLIRFEDV